MSNPNDTITGSATIKDHGSDPSIQRSQTSEQDQHLAQQAAAAPQSTIEVIDKPNKMTPTESKHDFNQSTATSASVPSQSFVTNNENPQVVPNPNQHQPLIHHQPLIQNPSQAIESQLNLAGPASNVPNTNNVQWIQQQQQQLQQQQQQTASQSQMQSSQKIPVTKVKLYDELNIFDWLRTTDIINQIAEKAKSSVDSVITTLDPGMKEYLYSGGNINIMVISDSIYQVGPIRDAFQSVFGRATVTAARAISTEIALDYPIKTAIGPEETINVAHNKIKRLQLDTNNVPQNQVIVVLQPSLVEETSYTTKDESKQCAITTLPKWFLRYCLIIEDPVLGTEMRSYSQHIPIDTDVVEQAKQAEFPPDFPDRTLGSPKSIDELMAVKLNLAAGEHHEMDPAWLLKWAGIDELQILHQLGLTLAHLYRRRWSACINS